MGHRRPPLIRSEAELLTLLAGIVFYALAVTCAAPSTSAPEVGDPSWGDVE